MKRYCSLLLVFALLLGIPVSCGEALVLPSGAWDESGESARFVIASDMPLGTEAQAVAESAGIPLEEGILLAGTALSPEQLLGLYPGTEDYFQVPEPAPALSLFELTGEWYYTGMGELVYKHNEGAPIRPAEEVFEIIGGDPQTATDNQRTIYLTIDDAPSQYTMELLAVLDRLDVPATFFIVGAYVKKHPVYVRAMHDLGHVLANHSYSHNAELLSGEYKNCLRDFERCEEEVAGALGFALPMPILRIPYGSTTIPEEFRTQLQKAGYMWIDWNALNGDTESGIESDEDALERAIDTASRFDGDIVMLVHDGKRRTIRTMEAMVTHFREQGYEFRLLTTEIEKIPGVRTGYPK